MDHRDNIIILGAGVIGAYTALALQRSGRNVTLIDKGEPGSETSEGNAGVLNRGSILPLNNPNLLKNLPSLLLKRQPGFDYSTLYMLKNLLWGLKFLSHSNISDTFKRGAALNSLICRSAEIYPELLKETGAIKYLRDGGWLKLYRDNPPAINDFELRLLQENNVKFDILDGHEIIELEPSLNNIYQQAIWIKETAFLTDPGKSIGAIIKKFVANGGTFMKSNILKANKENNGWSIENHGQKKIFADHIIVALGPWSRDWLKHLNINLPMVFERGAHREFKPGAIPLTRPIHDVSGAYVLSPLLNRWRMTCGVELAEQNAPRNSRQLDEANVKMHEAIDVGRKLNKNDWLGCRPTLPDSLPVIGQTRLPGLWLATGHQHIGISTAPATGELIADMINNKKMKIDAIPFSPVRFNL